MKALIDTNSYSRLHKGDVKVEEEISKAKEVLVSAVTLGELHLGFLEGTKRRSNLYFLKKFLQKPSVRILQVGKKTSAIYAKVKFQLRKKGTPIPENDIWIAAQVIETGAALVTYDSHFLEIPRLKVWKNLKTKK